MKALSPEQRKERTALAKRIREAYADLEAAVDLANDILSSMVDDLQAGATEMNEMIGEANDWLDEADIDIPADRLKLDLPSSIRLPECDLAERLDRL